MKLQMIVGSDRDAKLVKNKFDMDAIHLLAPNMKTTIILLPDDYIVGVDIRTQVHAMVIILMETEIPKRTAFM